MKLRQPFSGFIFSQLCGVHGWLSKTSQRVGKDEKFLYGFIKNLLEFFTEQRVNKPEENLFHSKSDL